MEEWKKRINEYNNDDDHDDIDEKRKRRTHRGNSRIECRT